MIIYLLRPLFAGLVFLAFNLNASQVEKDVTSTINNWVFWRGGQLAVLNCACLSVTTVAIPGCRYAPSSSNPFRPAGIEFNNIRIRIDKSSLRF